jgi:hypothetical protein
VLVLFLDIVTQAKYPEEPLPPSRELARLADLQLLELGLLLHGLFTAAERERERGRGM